MTEGSFATKVNQAGGAHEQLPSHLMSKPAVEGQGVASSQAGHVRQLTSYTSFLPVLLAYQDQGKTSAGKEVPCLEEACVGAMWLRGAAGGAAAWGGAGVHCVPTDGTGGLSYNHTRFSHLTQTPGHTTGCSVAAIEVPASIMTRQITALWRPWVSLLAGGEPCIGYSTQLKVRYLRAVCRGFWNSHKQWLV